MHFVRLGGVFPSKTNVIHCVFSGSDVRSKWWLLLFIITSYNRTPQSLNRRHSCLPLHRSRHNGRQLSQGGSKVRQPCQSTIVGAACTEQRHSDRNLRTAWFENKKKLIKKKKTLGGFLSLDGCVHTLPTHVYGQTTCKVNFASDDSYLHLMIIFTYFLKD